MKSADEWAESEDGCALVKFISSRHGTKSQEYLVLYNFAEDIQRDALESVIPIVTKHWDGEHEDLPMIHDEIRKLVDPK